MEQHIKNQLHGGRNGRLDMLFEVWRNSYPEELRKMFCPDGLVVKDKPQESGYDIDEQWGKARRKIMFIVKDCPDGWGWDTREVLVCPGGKQTQRLKSSTGFYPNIAVILHALYNLTKDTVGEGENKEVTDDVAKGFNDIPFAIVEAKKIAGNRQCSDQELRAAIDRDGKMLSEEISILGPDIIVACDSHGIIFDGVVEHHFTGREPDERWEYVYPDATFKCRMYFYKNENILLIESFHPTRLGKEGWAIYEKVISPFRSFLNEYGDDGIWPRSVRQSP